MEERPKNKGKKKNFCWPSLPSRYSSYCAFIISSICMVRLYITRSATVDGFGFQQQRHLQSSRHRHKWRWFCRQRVCVPRCTAKCMPIVCEMVSKNEKGMRRGRVVCSVFWSKLITTWSAGWICVQSLTGAQILKARVKSVAGIEMMLRVWMRIFS